MRFFGYFCRVPKLVQYRSLRILLHFPFDRCFSHKGIVPLQSVLPVKNIPHDIRVIVHAADLESVPDYLERVLELQACK